MKMQNLRASAILLRTVFLLVLAATAGALAGTAAAFMVAPYSATGLVSTPPPATIAPPAPTSTSSEPSLVRLQPRLAESLLPPGFLTRRASPVATVYRRAKGATVEDRILTDDRMLGQAVALTSDGWFVTAAAVASAPIADLTVWHDGKAYPVTNGISDRVNGTVYLKVASSELSVPAFGDVLDLAPGSEIWTERRARSFSPSLATSLTERMGSADAASSDVATRRIALDGTSAKGDLGSPAWNPGGALIGIVESAPGEPVRIIPSSSISASFSSLLAGGSIRHASLGVRTVDLSSWRVDGDRGTLPTRGALIHDDRKTGKAGVAKDSPAAKAGLKAGDVILAVERDILDGSRDLGEVLAEYRPGTAVTLRVSRDGKESDIPVALGIVTTGDLLK